MALVQVSFIGPGRRRGNDSKAGYTGYDTATYEFGAGEEYTTSVFGWALWQHLARAWRTAPNLWLVLGTTGSSWLALADELKNAEAVDDNDIGALLQWVEDLEKRTREYPPLASPLLSPKQAELAAGEGMPDLTLRLLPPRPGQERSETAANSPRLRLAVIGGCGDRASQEHLMGLLMGCFGQVLGQNSRATGWSAGIEPGAPATVVLDITHAYRHMPVMASFMLMALQWLLGVRIGGIFYGALEMPTNKRGKHVVVDLSICGEYVDIGAKLATYRNTGSFSRLASAFPAIAEEIEMASFFEGINRLTMAKGPALEARNNLRVNQPADPFIGAVAEEMMDALSWAEQGKLAERILEKSKLFLAQDDYIRAATLAFEAICRHAATQAANGRGHTLRYDSTAREEGWAWLEHRLQADAGHLKTLRKLRRLRNTIVHGTDPQGEDLGAFATRDALKAELQRGLDIAGWIIQNLRESSRTST